MASNGTENGKTTVSDKGASDGQEPQASTVLTSSQYPPPPVFYKSYGPGGSLHEDATSLRPPKIPKLDYQAFGEEWKVEETTRTLKEEGRRQLFEDLDSSELKPAIHKLMKDLLALYREILLSIADPRIVQSERTQKMAKEVDDYYVNIIYLINQFRSRQAREILLKKMKDQVEGRKNSTSRLKEIMANARKNIEVLSKQLKHEDEGENSKDADIQNNTKHLQKEAGLNCFDLLDSLHKAAVKETATE